MGAAHPAVFSLLKMSPIIKKKEIREATEAEGMGAGELEGQEAAR